MDVAAIQRALLARGYDLGPAGADGDAGPRTIAALQAFQRSAGLVADGIAGPLTERALTIAIGDNGGPPLRRTADRPPWLVLAAADIGTVEGIGKGNNPKVLAYFRDAGFPGIKDDAVAWCAAGAGAWLWRSGHGRSGSLAARSYETWGVGLSKPALGAVGVKKRKGGGWLGHVGFVVGASAAKIILLGGNQNDRVSVASFDRDEFTGFRWPSDCPLPTSYDLPASVAGARAGVSEA